LVFGDVVAFVVSDYHKRVIASY